MAKLFTPGPLSTSMSVKEAMLIDLGSRDTQFIETVKFIREKLLEIADGDPIKHSVVPLQGSGSYAVEAVLANVIGKNGGEVLVLSNGPYADRISLMCKQAEYDHEILRFAENKKMDLGEIEVKLKRKENKYTLVTVVHCETSTGNFNPVHEIARLVKTHTDAYFFVDAMSSFGAVSLSLRDTPIDFLVSSPNKCLQGVPGFSYVIARIDALKECEGRCISWSFDLVAQYKGFEANGQFRCTPPTHSLLAFKQALIEFEKEGNLGRQRRYMSNNKIVRKGMKNLGFKTSLDDDTYIVTSFLCPDDSKFNFEIFYHKLRKNQHVIYRNSGKINQFDCFRIGHIGDLYAADCENLVNLIENVLEEMGVAIPVTYNDTLETSTIG